MINNWYYKIRYGYRFQDFLTLSVTIIRTGNLSGMDVSVFFLNVVVGLVVTSAGHEVHGSIPGLGEVLLGFSLQVKSQCGDGKHSEVSKSCKASSEAE